MNIINLIAMAFISTSAKQDKKQNIIPMGDGCNWCQVDNNGNVTSCTLAYCHYSWSIKPKEDKKPDDECKINHTRCL